MYRLGIGLIAFALVFNGVAAAYALNDAPGLPAVAAHEHHGGVAHRDHAHDRVAVAADAGQTHGGMQDHLKCCGRCNFVSLLPGSVAIPVTFSYATVSFPKAQPHLVGHIVALDPGIPKSVV